MKNKLIIACISTTFFASSLSYAIMADGDPIGCLIRCLEVGQAKKTCEYICNEPKK